ncbi:hypothetical protein HanIR_Chr01g0037631 [Helianthus annuus]|nr:hypothetical protein HanIR_Chr01g0037631 [Helianthus annuus]
MRLNYHLHLPHLRFHPHRLKLPRHIHLHPHNPSPNLLTASTISFITLSPSLFLFNLPHPPDPYPGFIFSGKSSNNLLFLADVITAKLGILILTLLPSPSPLLLPL